MSSISSKVEELEKEREELEKPKGLREEISEHVSRVQMTAGEIDPHILERHVGPGVLGTFEESELHLLVHQMAIHCDTLKKLDSIHTDVKKVPDEVAKKTLCRPTDARWLGDAVLKSVIGVGVAAAVHAAAPRIYNVVRRKTLGVPSDPFSDTTVVAQARPRGKSSKVAAMSDYR